MVKRVSLAVCTMRGGRICFPLLEMNSSLGIEEILVGGTCGGFDDDDDDDVDDFDIGDLDGASAKKPESCVVVTVDSPATRASKDETAAAAAAVVEALQQLPQQPIVLKGMLTTTSPPGSVVEFSSWCLTRIGNAGSYNAGKGVGA